VALAEGRAKEFGETVDPVRSCSGLLGRRLLTMRRGGKRENRLTLQPTRWLTLRLTYPTLSRPCYTVGLSD
jgi:hypothetical protein